MHDCLHGRSDSAPAVSIIPVTALYTERKPQTHSLPHFGQDRIVPDESFSE
jgi:hypothetical protein